MGTPSSAPPADGGPVASRDLETRFTGDTSSLDAASARARGDMQKVSSTFSSAAGGIAKAGLAIGGAFAVDALVSFGTQSLSAASDLQESMSKVSTVFGTAGADMLKFVENANALNLSDTQAAALAGSMGNLAGQLGLASGPAAALTKDVMGLSADLGSFHNLDTADVMERIQKAMTGELDGVKQLAPALNAVAVEQRALADTGKESAAELTAQEKAMATYALITEQSSAAIGDLDRTSESAANQQKQLGTRMADLQTELGTKLLPAFEGLLSFLLDTALPGLQEFGRWFAETVPPWYATYVKPTVDAIVEVIRVAVEVIMVLWNTFGDNILKFLSTTFKAILTVIQGALKIITGVINVVLGILTGDWSRAWNGLKGVVSGVVDVVLGLVRNLKGQIELAVGVLADILAAPFRAAKDLIGRAINAIAGLWNRTIGALSFEVPSWVPGMGGKGFDVPNIGTARAAPTAMAGALTVVMPEGASGYSLTTTLRQYSRQGGNTDLATVAIA